MNQEKFINSYIELLTATVTESIQKNLVLQTQKKIAEQELNEFVNSINQSENTSKQDLINKQNEIISLTHQLNEMRNQRDSIGVETGELKKNLEHIDTFKNELVKARKHNENLVLKINDLESTIERLDKKTDDNKNLVIKINDLEVELKEKIKIIENLTTEMVKHLKPEIEAKKLGKKIVVKESELVEDAGSF